MSVEVSVWELESAMLDSPQFTCWAPDTEARFCNGPFCNCTVWDPIRAVEKCVLVGVRDYKINDDVKISETDNSFQIR